MSEYRLGVKWDQEKLSRLVILWNKSPTLDEALKRIGVGYSEALGQVYRLRSKGVKLKRFRARAIDFEALKRLSEKHSPDFPEVDR